MLGSILLVGCIVTGQAGADEDLQLAVDGLVRQLNATQLSQREEAEQELLKLGTEILPLLPKVIDRMPAEMRQRLGRVRQKLQRTAAEATASQSLVSLSATDVPLSEILAALEKQSGNKIELEARPGADGPPKLSVEFDKMPFWQALDRVLDQSGLAVAEYGQAGTITLVPRSQGQVSRAAAACYGGPFRFEPVFIEARRDLRNPDSRSLMLTLEVAWEPRLSPIGLKQKAAAFKAVDEQGKPLHFDDDRAEMEVPVEGVASVRLPLALTLPSRDVKRIASLKGTLTAMLPGKTETFVFDKLTDAKKVEKRAAGVTVTLVQARKNNAVWQVFVRVRFDEAGDALQSHRGWILNNEAYLEDPDGKRIDHAGYETAGQAENTVGIGYMFVLDGTLQGHKFVYKTPGLIVATGYDYEIKDIELP